MNILEIGGILIVAIAVYAVAVLFLTEGIKTALSRDLKITLSGWVCVLISWLIGGLCYYILDAGLNVTEASGGFGYAVFIVLTILLNTSYNKFTGLKKFVRDLFKKA